MILELQCVHTNPGLFTSASSLLLSAWLSQIFLMLWIRGHVLPGWFLWDRLFALRLWNFKIFTRQVAKHADYGCAYPNRDIPWYIFPAPHVWFYVHWFQTKAGKWKESNSASVQLHNAGGSVFSKKGNQIVVLV